MSLKEWKPTPRQEQFLSIPDSVFEGLYGGAAGGGKTECLLMLPLTKRDKLGQPLYKHPKFKMLYLRRTYPELDKEVIPRSREFYEAAGGSYNDNKKFWKFSPGSIVQFGHCEYEKDVYNYDTSEYTIIVWDEATSFTPFQYEYLTFSRCRTSSPDLTAFVRSGTNPGNIGHSYFRKRFIAPCKDGGVILKETRENQTLLRIFIPSKVQDNPHLMQNDPGYIARLNRLPEKERAAKADGDWYAYSGQVFSDFRENRIPGEPDYAVHVIPAFRIPDYWAVILSIDWGYSALMVAGWYAINPVVTDKHTAKVYKCYEYSALKTNIFKWAKDAGDISRRFNIVDTVLDPSAWGRRGDEFTISEQVDLHSGFNFRKADNDRIGGKILLQQYLDWQDGPPKLQIFDTCNETIKCIPLCNYKKDKDKPTTESGDEGNSEDVEEFRGDDAYDETRYGLKACQYYLDFGVKDFDRISKVAKACSVLEQDPSPSTMTTFYYRMNKLEAEERRALTPLRRFHGTKLRKANF